MLFQCLAFFLPGENHYCLVDVHYKVVPSFPYNPRLNAAFVLFGAAYTFNFASICSVKSRVAFIRVITVYESTTISPFYITVYEQKGSNV